MPSQIAELQNKGQVLEEIPVHISYEIIHLFSEGLYKSPHKAIEELVTNSYDASAKRVHILLPEASEASATVDSPLWVIDDGHGMDEKGFHQLWLIAESSKADVAQINGRPMIGQFGIGKLASYVLAWNLTHISCVNGRYLLTSMNFHDVRGQRLSDTKSFSISLREVSEAIAKDHLADIRDRDSGAWDLMFGSKERSESWTVAALSDFKDLYGRLQTGTLKWVLSTGLPLHTDFQLWVNTEKLRSSKENLTPLKTVTIDKSIPGIGPVRGAASIYDRTLSGGKSDQIARSNGIFIRVQKRVINLEDELFGLEAQNHAAWSRFALEIDADGLRDHLLSSREGVRESDAVRAFREELRAAFNACRVVYDTQERQKWLDIIQLLEETPSSYIRDPLVLSVRSTAASGVESFYVNTPSGLESTDESEWLSEFEERIKEKPFERLLFEKSGQNSPVLRYEPDSRNLVINSDHPFIDKISDAGRRKRLAELFASSETLLEGQLQDHGINRAVIASLLDDRDRALRLLAGNDAPTAQEVIRRLHNATHDPTALERATGVVFQLLGFRYERKGGNSPGPDGVLVARLGRQDASSADYKVVYDAKQTNQPSVPADKVNLGGLEDFRTKWGADFGFFIAEKYQAEYDDDGKLNRQFSNDEKRFGCLTLLKVKHLETLVALHYQHGVTLTELRSLFNEARTVPEVDTWLEELKNKLADIGEIPLLTLLQCLEDLKEDSYAKPNLAVVRRLREEFKPFTPERLTARLKALESIIGSRWIEVDEESYEVAMHQSDKEILGELERNATDLYGKFEFDPLGTPR